MFAIIRTGSKQYKVKPGDELQIELLAHGKAKTLKLDHVMLVSKDGSVQTGNPYVKGAYCEAEVVKESKGPKKVSFKYTRREKSATKIGHRQKYLTVKVKAIHNS